MARLGPDDLQTLDTLITTGIASSRAEGLRWALARIRDARLTSSFALAPWRSKNSKPRSERRGCVPPASFQRRTRGQPPATPCTTRAACSKAGAGPRRPGRSSRSTRCLPPPAERPVRSAAAAPPTRPAACPAAHPAAPPRPAGTGRTPPRSPRCTSRRPRRAGQHRLGGQPPADHGRADALALQRVDQARGVPGQQDVAGRRGSTGPAHPQPSAHDPARRRGGIAAQIAPLGEQRDQPVQVTAQRRGLPGPAPGAEPDPDAHVGLPVRAGEQPAVPGVDAPRARVEQDQQRQRDLRGQVGPDRKAPQRRLRSSIPASRATGLSAPSAPMMTSPASRWPSPESTAATRPSGPGSAAVIRALTGARPPPPPPRAARGLARGAAR